MTQQQQYTADHAIAKVIICMSYIVLGAISIETGNAYIALMIGTVVWFFGVNATAYMIEKVAGHKHHHNLI